jgi:tetratricopeptide (TPR) repeat protein
MIAVVGVLLLALAAPVQPSATASTSASAPAPAGHGISSRRAGASGPSFEQVSEAAMEAWNEHRDDDAVRLFQQGLKISPDWDEGLWYLGAIFYDKERFREARDLLRHYVAQNPNQGPAWALLGLCDYKLREYGRALSHLERAISLGLEGREQLESAVLYHKAILLIRDGQCEAGLRALYPLRGGAVPRVQAPLEIPAGLSVLCYQLLPEEVPADRSEFVRKMGEVIFARMDGHSEDALNILRDLVRQHPNEKAVHYQYGSVLLGERSPAGVEEMQKVLEISPSSTEARMELAAYYVSQSQPEKARLNVEEVLKLDPSHVSGHVFMGEILMSSGDASAAVKELEQAKQLAPEEGRVLWALLRAYNAAGRPDDAARVKAEIEKIEAKAASAK